MKHFRLLTVCLAFLISGTIAAQDTHYSLFNMSPLTLNPALTGAFNGTFRVGGIYRDQWNNIPGVEGFSTPSFYVDAPIVRGFRKQDWVGVGGMIVSDQAGSAGLSTTSSMLSASYHMAMNKKATTYLTLGVQGGNVQRSIDQNDLIFGDVLEGELNGTPLTESDDIANLMDNSSYLDFAVGLMLRSQLDKTSNLEIGISAAHILQPDYSLVQGSGATGDGAEDRPLTFIVHGNYQTDVAEKVRIAPAAFFQTTTGGTEISLQAWGGYYLGKEVKTDIVLNFGLGYRVGDAPKLLAGLDYKDLKVALAYDATISSLNETVSVPSSFEIAAYYIVKIFKKPTVKPAVLCPKF